MKLKSKLTAVFFSIALVALAAPSFAQPPVHNGPVNRPQQGDNAFDQFRAQLRTCAMYDVACVGGIILNAMEYVAFRMAPQPVPMPAPVPQNFKTVQFFSDDSCRSFLTEVRLTGSIQADQDMCKLKQQSVGRAVWSIRVGDQCLDIADTTFLAACIGQI